MGRPMRAFSMKAEVLIPEHVPNMHQCSRYIMLLSCTISFPAVCNVVMKFTGKASY